MISTGKRDKRVRLDAPGAFVPDGEGGYIEGYAPLDPPEMLVRINPASSQDLERAAVGGVVTIGQAAYVIEMLYHPQVSLDTRLQYDDPRKGETRTFQISSVRDPDEQNRELVIVATEIVGDTSAPPPSSAGE